MNDAIIVKNSREPSIAITPVNLILQSQSARISTHFHFVFLSKYLLTRFAHPPALFSSSLSTPPYLLLQNLFSMADPSNLSAVSSEDAGKFGFTRDEMYSSNLAGTVNPYDRHLFLRHKSYNDWASRVEEDGLPNLLSSALKSRKNDIPVKNAKIMSEGIFMLILFYRIDGRGLTDSDVDGFVEDVLVNGKPWASGVQETLTGSYIFVCAHGNRDKRCGVCGPALIQKLNEEIELRGLKDQVFVSACSHIGGHKYAGNLIIFSLDSEGKITGNWYGYVTPEDVPELLDQQIAKGEIIQRLWRFVVFLIYAVLKLVESVVFQGQMGASTEGGDKTDEQKLPNGTEVKKNENHEETTTQKTKENVDGCCQGANGFTCCMTASLEANEKEKSEEPREVCGKTGMCKLASWVESWEQHHVLTAAAVVGVVATVAVAYSYYRRSG
ncbi:Sucraseferredoxin-like protein [Gossypium australe]|uniref:Sucraseferredoxin-like protein n=1 Tax=Gossypium australe TaxID=47621 RepID=A0A5B6UQL8_9ROSI|nr:Sucraseferredoxin-like protein [Gossypium australe]